MTLTFLDRGQPGLFESDKNPKVAIDRLDSPLRSFCSQISQLMKFENYFLHSENVLKGIMFNLTLSNMSIKVNS